jgi:formylglycine-generating enzyme
MLSRFTRRLLAIHIAAALCLLALPAHAVTIDMVTVGNLGNANDTTGYGAVDYPYQIGKYDVTIGQYTAFLNVVAKTDTYSLYNENMALDFNVAGISRTGVSGSYSYSVKNNGGDSSNRPITYVSWWDAARFANWMTNGQQPGGGGDLEDGAYSLNGATSGNAPGRTVGAEFYIPTENEWYKAAYFDPTLNSGSGGYYTYATQSNTAPGNIVGSGANQANYAPGGVYSLTQSSSYDPNQNYLTDVGAFSGSGSFYGTFDQSGNVYQWNDLDGLASSGSSRGLRGGCLCNFDPFGLSSSGSYSSVPSDEYGNVGFRLASPVAVPEPSTWVMAAGGLACAGWGAWRRRRARS